MRVRLASLLVADAYYAALARKDFRAVCDTLAPSERRHFAGDISRRRPR